MARRTSKVAAKAATNGKNKGKDGTGLDGLTVDEETVLLDPDDIELPPPGHFLYDPRNDLPVNELAVRNFMAIGVLQNVVVTKITGKWWCVAGRQRVKTCREVKRRQVEAGIQPTIRVSAKIRRGAEAFLVGIRMSENAFRKQASPMEQAKDIQTLLDMGMPKESLPAFINLKPKTIERRLRLLELGPKARDATSKGAVPATAAARLAQKSAKVQQEVEEKLAKVTDDQQARAVVEEAVGEAPKGQPRKVLKALTEDVLLDDPLRLLIQWILGDVDDKAACAGIEGLAVALEKVRDGSSEKAMARAKSIRVMGGSSKKKATVAATASVDDEGDDD